MSEEAQESSQESVSFLSSSQDLSVTLPESDLQLENVLRTTSDLQKSLLELKDKVASNEKGTGIDYGFI
jgi:hypothetical protein